MPYLSNNNNKTHTGNAKSLHQPMHIVALIQKRIEMDRKCPQKVSNQRVHKKCPQKVSPKFFKKVSTKKGREEKSELKGSGR